MVLQEGVAQTPSFFMFMNVFVGLIVIRYHGVFYFVSVIKSTNKLHRAETCRPQNVNIQDSSP